MNKKTCWCLLAILPLVTFDLFALDAPKLEVFGGYAYFRLPKEAASGMTAADLNGWDASIKLNVRPRVGVLVDFSGNYGELRMLPTQFQPRETKPGNYRQHTVLFGPEVRVLGTDRLDVNVRALIGAAYVDEYSLALREPFQPPPGSGGSVQPPVTEFRFGGEKPVTGLIGGSVDYRISGPLSYRVIQPDLVVTHLGGLNRKNLRISTGIVFTFGGL